MLEGFLLGLVMAFSAPEIQSKWCDDDHDCSDADGLSTNIYPQYMSESRLTRGRCKVPNTRALKGLCTSLGAFKLRPPRLSTEVAYAHQQQMPQGASLPS